MATFLGTEVPGLVSAPAKEPGWLDRVMGALSAFGQSQQTQFVTGPTGTYAVPQQSPGIFGMPTWLVLGGAGLVAYMLLKKKR